MKKWPVAVVKKAHEGVPGDCWISALRSLKNTDLIASGLPPPLSNADPLLVANN